MARISEYIRKRKIDTNKCPNIYSWPIYSNIRIFEYIRHTLIHIWIYPISIIHIPIYPYIHISLHPYIHISLYPFIHISIYPYGRVALWRGDLLWIYIHIHRSYGRMALSFIWWSWDWFSKKKLRTNSLNCLLFLIRLTQQALCWAPMSPLYIQT